MTVMVAVPAMPVMLRLSLRNKGSGKHQYRDDRK